MTKPYSMTDCEAQEKIALPKISLTLGETDIGKGFIIATRSVKKKRKEIKMGLG